jgi:hypothetical protein
MDRLAAVLLALVGLIHLLPAVGVLGVARLESLYGVGIAGPDLEILMRHRAVLFGLLGGYQWWAVARPEHRTVAFVLGIASLAAFCALAWSVGGYGAALRRVVTIDVVALGLAVAGLLAHLRGVR